MKRHKQRSDRSERMPLSSSVRPPVRGRDAWRRFGVVIVAGMMNEASAVAGPCVAADLDKMVPEEALLQFVRPSILWFYGLAPQKWRAGFLLGGSPFEGSRADESSAE
jgi:hypothetical protein